MAKKIIKLIRFIKSRAVRTKHIPTVGACGAYEGE